MPRHGSSQEKFKVQVLLLSPALNIIPVRQFEMPIALDIHGELSS